MAKTPWQLGQAKDGTWYIQPADIKGPPWLSETCIAAIRPGPDAKEMAELMVAAPDLRDANVSMHKALKDCVTALEFLKRNLDDPNWLNQARAAIAQAEGRKGA